MDILHLKLPEETERRLVFYLAMEEWAVRNVPDSFFVWSVQPTVIFGRNQDMEAEVNVDYCRKHHIQMYRRKSGGGCVYSDKGNLMLSYITGGTDVDAAFRNYLDHLASVLRELGLAAVTTAHNDILVNGYKVSGNACFATPTGCIVHGTLLYDGNFSEMEKAITPSREKLESKGIKSVRQRVANLKELCTEFDIDSLKLRIIDYFCNKESVLSNEDVKDIESIEQGYLDENFIRYGRRV
ncbi:MAG: lipoate--protein ligase family protein [Bacteroidaceae bacterium]|nr:lipoate--protein ligase family protein [Bacteroidaceae bacterium]